MDSLPVLIGKRLLFGIVTLIVISFMIAVGVELLPGDSRRGHSRSVRDAGDGSRVPPGAGSRPALVHALRHLARELHDRRHGHLARQQARDIGAHRHPARQHPLSRAERRGDCDAARGLSRHDGRPVPRDPVRQDDLDDDALHHFLSGVLRRLHPDRSPLGTVERIPEHLQHLPRHDARRQAPCGGAAGTHSHPGGGGAHDAHDPRRHHQSDDEPLHRDGGPQGHQAQTHHRASRFPQRAVTGHQRDRPQPCLPGGRRGGGRGGVRSIPALASSSSTRCRSGICR